MQALPNKRHVLTAVVIALGLMSGPSSSIAHPMPDSEIDVAFGEGEVNLLIHVPLEDLALVIGGGLDTTEDALSDVEVKLLKTYFEQHTHLTVASGDAIKVSVEEIQLQGESDVDVGDYQEVQVIVSAKVDGRQLLTLHYDAILHQVANHRAIVSSMGRAVGIIRFDLANKRSNSLELPMP